MKIVEYTKQEGGGVMRKILENLWGLGDLGTTVGKTHEESKQYDVDQAEKEIMALLPSEDDILHNDFTPDLVEKHFPKGDCSERGQAIVLHAEMLIWFNKRLRGEG